MRPFPVPKGKGIAPAAGKVGSRLCTKGRKWSSGCAIYVDGEQSFDVILPMLAGWGIAGSAKRARVTPGGMMEETAKRIEQEEEAKRADSGL